MNICTLIDHAAGLIDEAGWKNPEYVRGVVSLVARAANNAGFGEEDHAVIERMIRAVQINTRTR